jgi:methylamine dehydrogenase heavy chain
MSSSRLNPSGRLRGCAMIVALLECVALARAAGPEQYPAPLPSDLELKVETLPAQYPKNWAVLAYGNEKFEIRDVGSDERAVKGHLPGHESATLLVATTRPELYVADTVWARGNRGARTDFITVYDKRTLQPIGEIVLPGAKRALVVPMQGMFAFADEERLGLVFNFTPAASVTVVDLVQRKVLREVEIPGCSLAYPTGRRGFSTLCSGGTLLSVGLDAKGAVTRRKESQSFNPLDTDPLFTASTVVNGIRYFPSIHGRVQPVDMRQDEAMILPDWSLVTAEEAAANWRPGGLQVMASGDDGRLYVIMQPDAGERSYKDPGTEVWVFDPLTRTRLARLRLVRPGYSIEVTHDREPLLLVSTKEQLDVYGLQHGNLVRSLDAAAKRGGMLLEAVR